ncbi:iron complex transport system substrate-binding protein [Haloactinopolyspora alba]|uniref:Iron complex transport system substrate-binding protein n=1 Tax=Haloactinopolyspora alba TaxID=648780 RepID=A0A2P8EGG4_9ACTN|nr:ABC transporter substrate-binding protein [Haloactinopolyspora alba]PSL08551.1 iron complex transport system substrate-binding protein [Haloactinopolyspora alba]
MRIVSLLPSTTETLFAIGAGDDVVGVTFECDHPAEARTRTIVSTSALPDGLAPGRIDEIVSRRMAAGEDLYHLDQGALAGLDADLVVTQDLCAVCAVDVSNVQDALEHLVCSADVLTIDPQNLAEVLASVRTLGNATGTGDRADELVTSLTGRLDAVRATIAHRRHVPALVLEWTDPPFAPGHWVPDMVEAAGGTCVLGEAGERSYRTDPAVVRGSAAEVVVCAPCGFGLDESTRLAHELVEHDGVAPGTPVWAVDANASFARPGPRLVDGVEALAAILHPEAAGPPDPALARRVR